MDPDNLVGDGGDQDPEADFEDVLNEGEVEDVDDASDSGESDDSDNESDDSPHDESDPKSSEESVADEDEDEPEEELGPEELDSDLEEIQGRVSFRDLKAKYPDIFKKVPELRHALNREREYSELFPTVEDAKSAAASNETLQQFDAQITAGVSIHMLASMAQKAPETFQKYTQGFLPSLKEISPRAYYHVVAPAIVEALATVQEHAKTLGSKDLALSVQNISRVLFKNENLPDLKFGDIPQQANNGPSEREQELVQRQFENFSADLEETTVAQVRQKLAKDPEIAKIRDPQYKEYVISQILNGADKLITKDPLYQRTLKSFQKRIQAGDMSPATKKQIVIAYLRRVESFMGPVKRKILANSGRPAQKPAEKKKFRPSSTTQNNQQKTNPSGKSSGPKLFGSVKDDAKFLGS